MGKCISKTHFGTQLVVVRTLLPAQFCCLKAEQFFIVTQHEIKPCCEHLCFPFPFTVVILHRTASITGTLSHISKGKEGALALNRTAAIRSGISLDIVGSTWNHLLEGRHSDSEEM